MGNLPGARAEIAQYAQGGVLYSLAYGAIASLLFFGSKGNGQQRAVKSVLTVLAMGALDEYIQTFFPIAVQT